MNAMLDIRETLGQAFESNDRTAFNDAYRNFLAQFDSFNAALSPDNKGIAAPNAIFGGEPPFYYKKTTSEESEGLLKNARAASKVMGRLSVAERLEFLNTLNKHLAKHTDNIITTISADTGKPLALAEGEMSKGHEWFAYANKQAETQIGHKVISNNISLSTKPLGAALVVGAYNYPYALAIGGIVGALAGGNGLILSAPPKAPGWVFPFMQAAKEATAEFAQKAARENKPWAADFANHSNKLIQLSMGANRTLAPQADVVHFVGSDATGKQILAAREGKRTIVEMGGSNVVTVMKSALETQEADKIADTIYNAFGPATGQRCTAPRIICVQEGAEAVSEALKRHCSDGPGSMLGNPFKDGVKMGPMVDGEAYKKMQSAIALAQESGAEVCGTLDVNNNKVPMAGRDNNAPYWVNPIAIDWSNANSEYSNRIHEMLKDEIFGPLVHIIRPVKTIDEAIAVNNTLDSHKLAGAIFTSSEDEYWRYEHETNMTSLMVNAAPKDLSPWGQHGNNIEGMGLNAIGGTGHFNLYTSGHSTNHGAATNLR